MAFNFNIFRVLGDVSHTISKLILIWAIHSNKSAEGVSLITQILYIAVFCTRYLDLFWAPPFKNWEHWWNFVLKLFYIVSSAYIVFLMMRIYARTREREKSYKLGLWCAVGSLIAAPLVELIFEGTSRFRFAEILWVFSIILESICVLPQLLLLRQTTVPTVIDSFYLVTLGSYRAFYILNWIVRFAGPERHFDPIAVVFGVVQTALYVDFAWVYWTRQRVKLRGGGIVDSDDFSRGWLVNRIIGNKHVATADEDEERAPAVPNGNGNGNGAPKPANRWGARGISISADEGVEGAPNKKNGNHETGMTDPSAFEDDDDLDDDAQETTRLNGEASAVGDGAEWRDDQGK